MQLNQHLNFHRYRNKKNRFLTSLLVLFCLFSLMLGCGNRFDRARIEGYFDSYPKSWFFISKLEGDTLRVIDSIRTNSKGVFKVKYECSTPYILTLGLDRVQNPIVLVVEPGNEMKISASGSDITDYKVIGSDGSALVRSMTRKLNRTRFQIDSISKCYDRNANNIKFDSIQHLLDSIYRSVLADHQKFTYSIIKDNPYSFASMLALFQAYDPQHPVLDYSKDKDLFKFVDASLLSVYSSNSLAKTFHKKILGLDTLYAQQQKRESMFKVGWVLPDAAFPLITGERLFTSTIWCKYILIDFWANWCEECKKNTALLRDIYKEYNPKGLAIVQVSLDSNLDSLKSMVARDSLMWYHAQIQDVYTSRLLDTLRVSSIPASYIIDRWGNIKAVNIKSDSLRVKLKELFPK